MYHNTYACPEDIYNASQNTSTHTTNTTIPNLLSSPLPHPFFWLHTLSHRPKNVPLALPSLPHPLRLPYITEEGVLELTLKCSKKRYDGYLRMWKRKLYEYAGLQRLDFKGFPPLPEEAENTATSIIFETTDTLTNAAPPTPDDAVVVSSAPAPRGRKQSNPARLPTASAQAPQGSWAKKLS